jgi:alpha-ketoglutarate-dependent taurine dioxygenase
MSVTVKLHDGRRSPLVVQALKRMSLDEWLVEKRDWVREMTWDTGAVFFRGFDMRNAEDTNRVADALGWPTMPYIGGATPRTALGGKVQTSTEMSSLLPIPMHNEMSYAAHWPEALLLHCIQPSRRDGLTPLACMADVYDELPADLRNRWEQKRLRMIRVAPRHPRFPFPKSWPQMFLTDDKAVVEALSAGERVEWGKDDLLTLSRDQDPSMIHGATGRRVWFNQAIGFHPTLSRELLHLGYYGRALALGYYETLMRLFPRVFRYPYRVCFADGSDIPRQDILTIRKTVWKHSVSVPWQAGDVVIVDNTRMGHARNPFSGPRKVVVVLFDQMSNAGVAGKRAA